MAPSRNCHSVQGVRSNLGAGFGAASCLRNCSIGFPLSATIVINVEGNTISGINYKELSLTNTLLFKNNLDLLPINLVFFVTLS
jgi:hypothetical protein